MSYRGAVKYLSSLQLFGAQLGLDRAIQLAALAGNPHQRLRFIHVAGTNGKGSTCAMLEAIYRASGLRVGLYTSPHLVSFRERMQVNRELISESDVVRFVAEGQRWLENFTPANHPTFFEVVTIMALRYFAEQKCDLVIWETGLGGRLDATNIVTPLASVITNVQFDHEKWLGDTLEKIAAEKAGIIKPGVPVVTATDAPEALAVIRETAGRVQAPLHVVSARAGNISLRGQHQQINAAVAMRTVEILQDVLPVATDAAAKALHAVKWAGRFQVFQRGAQTFVLDGAHNPAGVAALAQTLRETFPNQPFTLVLGVLEDKNWQTVCRTLAPLASRIVVTPVSSARTANAHALAVACRESNPNAEVNVAISLPQAIEELSLQRLVVITGSLYLIGEALEVFGLASAAQERTLNEWTPGPRP